MMVLVNMNHVLVVQMKKPVTTSQMQLSMMVLVNMNHVLVVQMKKLVTTSLMQLSMIKVVIILATDVLTLRL